MYDCNALQMPPTCFRGFLEFDFDIALLGVEADPSGCTSG